MTIMNAVSLERLMRGNEDLRDVRRFRYADGTWCVLATVVSAGICIAVSSTGAYQEWILNFYFGGRNKVVRS